METLYYYYLYYYYLVLTVPMRNGNLAKSVDGWDEKSVLTVPMRNGNTLGTHSGLNSPISSYRTYEEWKQVQCLLLCLHK